MFYFEEKDFAGRWRPRSAPEKPAETRPLRAVTKIPPALRDQPLDKMHDMFSPDRAGRQADG